MQPTDAKPPVAPRQAAPVMDVRPRTASPAADPAPEQQAPAKHASESPSKPQTPKQPSSGVGLAIFATVIIVLGLAALATYAYLKTR